MNKENYNPINRKQYLSFLHIERYKFACSMINKNEKVLDIACGSGYGTVLMKKKGITVFGADIDKQQIEENRKKWKSNNFLSADALDLPFQSNEFDTIVSFETIEHVHDAEFYLKEIGRVLKPNGKFFCSTPNIKYTSHPIFHKKEYQPEEFFTLVKKYFPHVTEYAQYFKYSDLFRDTIRRSFKKGAKRLFATINLTGPLLRIKGETEKKRLFKQSPNEDGLPIKQLATQIERNESKYYRVQTRKNSHMLRIMLVLATS